MSLMIKRRCRPRVPIAQAKTQTFNPPTTLDFLSKVNGFRDDTVTASALAAWGLSQNMGSAVIGTMETLGTITDNPAEVKYEQQEPVSAWSDDDWNPSGGVGVAQGHNKVVLKGL